MIATLVVFLLICIASYASGIAWSSFFEWLLHRFLMHSQKLMKYPHRAHQLEHHGIFAADGTYCIDHPAHNESSKKHLKFAWWNAPVLILLNAPIFAGIFFFVGGWPTMVSFILAMVSYYLAYEYLHYCMHVPRDRWFERTQVFKLIQDHHRVHHLRYLKNLNVVLPLADWVLHTRKSIKDPQIAKDLANAIGRSLKQQASPVS